MIEEAAGGGQRLFGESYVQEFAAKATRSHAPVEWHFIGALQSNKVKYLRGQGRAHSTRWTGFRSPRRSTASGASSGRIADILIQVNLGGEESKSGTDESRPDRTGAAGGRTARTCASRGLMTLPPYVDDPERVRPYFRRLRELAEEIDALQLPGVEMRRALHGNEPRFRGRRGGGGDPGAGRYGHLRRPRRQKAVP